MVELGKLVTVKTRDAWPHEAQDFTPWLLANATELGIALGMDLELQAAEHSVGNFSLDLVGVDVATGEKVIVENQLEKSDHIHLGQLLTYAGGTDPTNVVWIADDFRPEHRAALDWLNQRTDETTRFFAVKISAVRIGASLIAPLFELVVQPNDWEKEVRATTNATARSPKQENYRRFWQLFLEEIHATYPGWTNSKQPLAQNWMNLPTGTSACHYANVFSKEGRRVELYIGTADSELNTASFEKLKARKDGIEAAFGHPLEWEALDGKKACRIAYTQPGNVDDEANWAEHATWFVTHAGKLRDAFESQGGIAKLVGNE